LPREHDKELYDAPDEGIEASVDPQGDEPSPDDELGESGPAIYRPTQEVAVSAALRLARQQETRRTGVAEAANARTR
jgi:hypothetical protein